MTSPTYKCTNRDNTSIIGDIGYEEEDKDQEELECSHYMETTNDTQLDFMPTAF